MRARSRVAVIYSYTVGYHMVAIPRFSPRHSAKGTTSAGCKVRLAVRACRNAISVNAPILSVDMQLLARHLT